MAVNRSSVFDNFLRKSSKPFSTTFLIWEVDRAENICKKYSLHRLVFLRDRTTFEAFQSATYFSFGNWFPWVTFFWSPGINVTH